MPRLYKDALLSEQQREKEEGVSDTAGDEPLFPPLHWLGRRLVLPGLFSAVAVDVLLFAILALPSLSARSASALLELPDLGIMVLAFTLIPIFIGLLAFGLPAGLLVARLKLGLGDSLLWLTALGAAAGAAVPVLQGSRFGYTDLIEIGLFGLAGAVTASIWTLLNADLFGRK